MKKKRLNIERELLSNSSSIIWNLISTPEGLSRWIADDVKLEGKDLTLTWKKPDGSEKTMQAVVTHIHKNHSFRFRWVDDNDDNAFVELRMEKSDITNDHFLIITDFGTPDELEQLKDLWEEDFYRLHQNTGLL